MTNMLMVEASDATLILVPLFTVTIIGLIVVYILWNIFNERDERIFPIYGTDQSFNLGTLYFGLVLLSSIGNVRGLSIRVDNDVVLPSGEMRLVVLNIPINIVNDNSTLRFKQPRSICSNTEDGNIYYFECDNGKEKSDWFITNSVGYDNCIEGFKYTTTLSVSSNWSLCLNVETEKPINRTLRSANGYVKIMGNNIEVLEANKQNDSDKSRSKRWSVNFQDDCLCYLDWFTCISLICRTQINQMNSMANDIYNLKMNMMYSNMATQQGFNNIYSGVSNMTSALNTQIQGLAISQKYSMLMTYVTILEERIKNLNERDTRRMQFNEQQEFDLYILKEMMENGNKYNQLSMLSDDIMKTLFNITNSKGSYDSYVRLFNKVSKSRTYVNNTHIQIVTVTQVNSEFIESITYYNPSYCVGKLNAQCQDESYVVYYDNRTLLKVDDEKSAKCLTGEYCKLRPEIKKLQVTEFMTADVIVEDKTSLTSKITNNDYVKFESDKFIVVHSLVKLYCNEVQEGIFFLKKSKVQQSCYKDSLKTALEFIVPIYDSDNAITVALRGSTIATFIIDSGIKKVESNTINIALPTYDDSITKQIQEKMKTDNAKLDNQFSLINSRLESITTTSSSSVVYDNSTAIAGVVLVTLVIVYLILRLLMINLIKKGLIRCKCIKKFGEYLFAANEVAIKKSDWLSLDDGIKDKYVILERFRNNSTSVPYIIDKVFGSAVYIIKLKDGETYSANFS